MKDRWTRYCTPDQHEWLSEAKSCCPQTTPHTRSFTAHVVAFAWHRGVGLCLPHFSEGARIVQLSPE